MLATFSSGCAVRVGTGGPPNQSDPPSACSRVGGETQLDFGAGALSFAFLWDRDHYVIVYRDPSVGGGDIYAVRMATDGSVIGSPVDVDPTPASSDLPSIVATDTGFLVAWEEGSAGQAVLARALGPDATPTGNPVTIATTQASESRPVLAPSPGGAVVATWMDVIEGEGGVDFAIVDVADPALLQVGAPTRVAPADDDAWPWVAGDGSRAGIVWSDKTTGPYRMKFASIDPTNVSLVGQTSLQSNTSDDAQLARLISTAGGYLAAWEDENSDQNQIEMAVLAPDGTQQAGGIVEEPNSGDANWPNMAWAGSAGGIVYYQFRESRPQIFMSFVDATGKRVAGLYDLQVSNGTAGWSKYPDVVWTGSEFGVVYVDTRGGAPALYLQRVRCG